MHFSVMKILILKIEGIYFFYDFPSLCLPLLYIFLVLYRLRQIMYISLNFVYLPYL